MGSKIGTNERIHHLDQRGSSYNGVEFVEYQRFEGVKLVAEEPFGARQPEVSFFLMVTLWLALVPFRVTQVFVLHLCHFLHQENLMEREAMVQNPSSHCRDLTGRKVHAV